MALTACDLSSLMGNNNLNNGNNEGGFSRVSIDPNDAAIKIAEFVSVFPEVGDELNMDDYIDFDTGTDYRLEQFTFESSDQSVIAIEGYHARCLKEGFTKIKVSGPGLNTPVEVTFYVGSIAGNYVPSGSKALDGVINLNIARDNEGAYSFNLNIAPKSEGQKYNDLAIRSYQGAGTLTKNISPFLPFNFDGDAPSSLSPVTGYVTELVPEAADQFEELGQDVYGFMIADEDEGILMKVRFNNKFITLAA